MTKYIRNEEGGVHSVPDEHPVLPGYEEISRAEAKKANPQLFGAVDPQVTFSDDEIVRAASYKKLLADLNLVG